MRSFIQISKVGVCDPNGKEAFAIGLKGKCIAPVDRPLETFVREIVGVGSPCIGWSNNEAAEADIRAAIAILEKQLREEPMRVENAHEMTA